MVCELRLYDYSQFKSIYGKSGLDVRFHRGLNALVGENDSGKTTVVDALKLVLLTQSGESIGPTEDDFHVEGGKPARESRIECVLLVLREYDPARFRTAACAIPTPCLRLGGASPRPSRSASRQSSSAVVMLTSVASTFCFVLLRSLVTFLASMVFVTSCR
ncbi:MAG: AAA family ATPase [Atopobiaceae bacterium]|nr:AAA family ATPase [Atopobiaceae bacterium]